MHTFGNGAPQEALYEHLGFGGSGGVGGGEEEGGWGVGAAGRGGI